MRLLFAPVFARHPRPPCMSSRELRPTDCLSHIQQSPASGIRQPKARREEVSPQQVRAQRVSAGGRRRYVAQCEETPAENER